MFVKTIVEIRYFTWRSRELPTLVWLQTFMHDITFAIGIILYAICFKRYSRYRQVIDAESGQVITCRVPITINGWNYFTNVFLDVTTFAWLTVIILNVKEYWIQYFPHESNLRSFSMDIVPYLSFLLFNSITVVPKQKLQLDRWRKW